MKLLYVMSGLLLMTNIDNFIAELFSLQLDKNHKEVKKHGFYLSFKACHNDTDVAYWYVIILFILNMVNNFTYMIILNYHDCPNTAEMVRA